jgi:hypothetical protein
VEYFALQESPKLKASEADEQELHGYSQNV